MENHINAVNSKSGYLAVEALPNRMVALTAVYHNHDSSQQAVITWRGIFNAINSLASVHNFQGALRRVVITEPQSYYKGINEIYATTTTINLYFIATKCGNDLMIVTKKDLNDALLSLTWWGRAILRLRTLLKIK